MRSKTLLGTVMLATERRGFPGDNAETVRSYDYRVSKRGFTPRSSPLVWIMSLALTFRLRRALPAFRGTGLRSRQIPLAGTTVYLAGRRHWLSFRVIAANQRSISAVALAIASSAFTTRRRRATGPGRRTRGDLKWSLKVHEPTGLGYFFESPIGGPATRLKWFDTISAIMVSHARSMFSPWHSKTKHRANRRPMKDDFATSALAYGLWFDV